MKLVKEQTYKVRHQRKGTFTMIVKDFGEIWVTGVVIDSNNSQLQGRVVVRRQFCNFTEIEE